MITVAGDEDERLKKEIEEHLKKDGLISRRKPLRDFGERAVRYKLSSVTAKHKLHDVSVTTWALK